jgi:cell wall-associated NlpC family hydrolase
MVAGSWSGTGWRLALALVVLVLVCLVVLFGADAVSAEPAEITQAKREAQSLRELIDGLEAELDAAVEEYNYALAMLEQSKAEAERTQVLLAQAEEDFARAEAQLADRLVEIYKQGRLGAIEALMTADSLAGLLGRFDLMKLVSGQDAELLAEVETYRDAKAAHAAELAVRIEEQTEYASRVEVAKAGVEERLAANEEALAGKEAEIAQLVKEEAERQARLAEEARRKAEEAARKAAAEKAAAERAAAERAAAAKAAASSQAQTQSSPVSVPASASSSEVVRIALQYLGCPYVWAGSTPDGFDCSGFVMYVYGQVGVSLPHSSRMQYGCGVSVGRADLKPGDLVFFYSPIHHVAIYIGEDKMVHAAGVGKGVRVDPVWTNSYTGACRVIQ